MNIETAYVPLSGMEIRDADDRHYIEGICVPWETRTDRVAGAPEMVMRGAFDDLIASSARVKLTDYNHDLKRVPVGYSTAVENRDSGLWARFRINDTPEGDSAIRNTAAGVYEGLSIGFVAKSDRIVAGVRQITAARLHHVSLVTEPAYAEARILEHRAAVDAEIASLRELIAATVAPIDTRQHMSQNLLIATIRRRSDSREP